MISTTKIEMDVSRNIGKFVPYIDVVQDDRYSRNIEITVLSNGSPLSLGATRALIRYVKEDGTGGNYDALPDGKTAFTISGNVVTIALAPQVCTAAGIVNLSVAIIDGTSYLHTFPIKIRVHRNPGLEVISENYLKIIGAVPDSGWPANVYLGTDKDGNVIARSGSSGGGGSDCVSYAPQTLTPEQQAQARENIDALQQPKAKTREQIAWVEYDDFYLMNDRPIYRIPGKQSWLQTADDFDFRIITQIDGVVYDLTKRDCEMVVEEYESGKIWYFLVKEPTGLLWVYPLIVANGVNPSTKEPDGSCSFTYSGFTPQGEYPNLWFYRITSERKLNVITSVNGVEADETGDVKVSAGVGQIKPEFANSIEECTDTSKLYVLPDGYIYAYMTKYGAQHTDLIPTAIDSDGAPYNGGLGYKMNWKLNSSGEEQQNADSAGSLLTGFIPYNPATVKKIRICGYPNAEISTNDWVHFYDASFAKIDMPVTNLWVSNYDQTIAKENAFDKDVNTFTFDLDTFTAKSSWYGSEIKNKAAYIRVSIQKAVKECAVVTFDEEISFAAHTAWQSTGHQFVPADYEERIIHLEQTAENHESRIKTLEMYGADSTSSNEIPAYIKTEADGLIDRLMEKQGNRAFTMVGISDFHYGGIGDNKDNLIRACKAISYIQGRIHVDAVATLGDNLPFGAGGDENMEKAHRWSREINEILKMTEAEGVAMFRTPGNHDRLGGLDENGNETSFMPDDDMYRYIGGYNRGCVVDVPGGWGYQDFESYKLRVVVLNTSEVEGRGRFSEFSGYHMSAKQQRWLIDTLDMSDKEDATDWQILILSHHRPDDDQECIIETCENGYILPNILHAYRTGGSFSGTRTDGEVISCDFAGKNQAALIGSIHGHHHAYIYGNVYRGSQSDSDATDVLAISTPTSAFGTGEGHNDDNDGNYYDSVKDTAEETAFCVYSIDLDNHMIHAIHYGNGIDREISYTIPADRAENVPATTGGVTSWNDLEDKPFYTEDQKEYILPETEYDMPPAGMGWPSQNITLAGNLVGGETYTVCYDGVEYEVVAKDYGNYVGFYVPTDGEAEMELFQYATYTVLNTSTEGLHVISISHGASVIHPLDDKYIPETIARVSDFPTETWTFELEDGTTVTKQVVVK